MSRTTPWDSIQSTSATSTGVVKDFTVPTNHEWIVQAVTGKLTASSVTGNRRLQMEIVDGSASSNVLATFQAGNTLSSATAGTVTWAGGLPNDTAFTGGFMHRGFPDGLGLSAGQIVRLTDSTAVSTLDQIQGWLIYEDHAD